MMNESHGFKSNMDIEVGDVYSFDSEKTIFVQVLTEPDGESFIGHDMTNDRYIHVFYTRDNPLRMKCNADDRYSTAFYELLVTDKVLDMDYLVNLKKSLQSLMNDMAQNVTMDSTRLECMEPKRRNRIISNLRDSYLCASAYDGLSSMIDRRMKECISF